MRCLTLARALIEQGASATFVSRSAAGNLSDVIKQHGIAVIDADDPNEGPASASNMLRKLSANSPKPDWIVVDHYEIDHDWERIVRPACSGLMVIDDTATRVHHCDVLLDQNLVDGMHTRYLDKTPPRCLQLLGLEYALLQPEYRHLRQSTKIPSGVVRRVLVYFGGADQDNVTAMAIRAVLACSKPDIALDVVLPSTSTHLESVRALVASQSSIALHTDLGSLAGLLIAADLSIGAAGATSWERLCLGVPSLVVTLAANQVPIAQELHRRGLVVWLGNVNEGTEDAIRMALSSLVEGGVDPAWSQKCQQHVDGRGASRVAAALTLSADTAVRAREVSAEDEARLLRWANDPGSRRNSFKQRSITQNEHHDWLSNILARPDTHRFYILETNHGLELGQVRFEKKGTEWEVHFGLAPEFRGRRLGKRVLDTAIGEFQATMGPVSIFGQVKNDNVPSIRTFESLQFEPRVTTGGNGITVYSLKSESIS